MSSCQRPSFLSTCCRRPASALPLYEVASPVLLVTMHSQPGRDLALGLRSLPAREGLRRFLPAAKREGWCACMELCHLSSLPSPISDLSRFSQRLRSAADTVSCQLCRADVSQVGASPLGLRPSPFMLLSWNPIQQCLASTGVPFSHFLLVGSCATCSLC